MRETALFVLFTLLALPCIAESRWPSPRDGVYRIQGDVDLLGATVTMTHGSVLDLTEGTLRNGTVIGDESSLVVKEGKEVLEGIILQGHWCGKVEDRWFRLEGNSPYWIISNVFKFNDVSFYRDTYWLELWRPILINRDHMTVHGHDVTLYLPAYKGEAEKGKWGYKYRMECLFSNPVRESNGESFIFEDIHIEDNAAVIGKSGWGENLEEFRIYFYFEIVAREIVFRNVSSDGAGILVQVYNLWQHIDHLEMDRCTVKAGQFALEVGNLTREGYPGGTCDDILVHNCRFYQYSCQPYVGMLSVVGDNLAERMLIENCFFDATEKDGNLELSSVKHIVLRNNVMVNQFVNSYPLPSIERYDILGNTFHFRKRRANVSFGFGGKEIVFKNNQLIYEDEDVGFITFSPSVRSLEMVQNTFDFSAVQKITEHRTALALSGLSLAGGRLSMIRNKVVPPSVHGPNYFIFRLPKRIDNDLGNNFEGVLIR